MSVDIIIDAHGPTIGVLSASRSTLNNNNSNVAGVSVRAGTGGGLLGASSGSLQLRAIATPIIDPGRGDSEGGKRLAGACPLTVIVPVVAVVIVVSIVTACLAPMTSLWVTSLNTMKSTCASSLSQEMNVYRKLLVDKSVTSITTEMWIPPTVGSILKIGIPESVYTSAVPLHVDRSGFQMTVRGLARQFRAINNIILSWTNYEGDHLYGDWQTYWGLYDSNVDSNITMYWFDGDTPTDQRKGGDILNYNLTLRDWWVVGVTAWNGSWTSVYKSANKADGRVIAYTIRPPVSVPVVIQVTLSISFLSDFFTNFNLTKNGVSFLVEDKTLDLVSGTPGITILTEDGETISATQSPDQTVRDTAGMWLNLTSELFVESHFKMADTDGMLFVDVVPIKASGGLVLWLFLVTPENDFMGEIESEQARTVSRAYLSLWSVLGIEIFIGMVAVVTSMTLSLVLARALTAVIRKLQKVSRGQLEKSESNKDLKRSMLREIDSLNAEVTVMQSALESFSQYVPTQVVKYLCKNHMKPVVGVTSMHCTVMFLDVVDFTRNMEQYGAQTVIEILSTMFESFSTIITKNNGCIDKYIGDAIMALWGCPMIDHNSEMNACQAVSEILADLARLNFVFASKSYPQMHIRIGLHAGEVKAGNVGSSQRLNFTVLGNTVNLAARLEPLNKELLTSVLVTNAIRDPVSLHNSTKFSWRSLGHIRVRGIKEPVLVHEFLGFSNKLAPETRTTLEKYADIDHLLYKKLSSKLSTPADVTDAMEYYLDQNPEDFTIAQAFKLLVNPRSTQGSKSRIETRH